MSFLTTVTGSYPRKEVQKDTLRKPSVSEEESFEMIKWAVKEQSDLGLDIITDGEGYRENMYWFYQLRLDGVDAVNKKRKDFSLGGSTEGVDLSKTHGTKGFGIECAVIKDEIKIRGKEKTITLSGKFTDAETIISSKLFSKGLGSDLYDCRFDNAQIIHGENESYKFNSSIQEVENADAILLVGSNPRWEASVLNARIRKAFVDNNCQVGLIGPALDLNYAYEEISVSLNGLNEILDNKSEFSKVLFNAKNPIIIVGTSAINTSEGSSVLKTCAAIARKLPNYSESFNPLNILNQDISRVGSLELGFVTSRKDFRVVRSSYSIDKDRINLHRSLLRDLNLNQKSKVAINA